MQRVGGADPTALKSGGTFVKAGWTPEGPACVELGRPDAAPRVVARAWGPGAAWVLERVAPWLGSEDRPETFAPPPGDPVRALMKKVPGLRIGRSPFPSDLHTGLVLQQRVTFGEAAESHRRIARRYGEAAPGPHGLVLFPRYETLRRIPSYELRALGVDGKRAAALIEAARLAPRVTGLLEGDTDQARRYLRAIPGTGPWTSELLLGFGFGDPDAVPTGDVHIPHDVSFALAGEPFTSDDRMLELLEPYRGHRFRVLRLIALAGPTRPYLDKGPPRGAASRRKTK